MAQEQFEDFCRQFPDSKGEKLFKVYVGKINWIFNDIITNPFLTEEVRSGIKIEINSDIFAIPAIHEKVALLTPEQRDMIELTLDAMINGEEVKIVDIKDINDGG
jgi:hypothetical protein